MLEVVTQSVSLYWGFTKPFLQQAEGSVEYNEFKPLSSNFMLFNPACLTDC